MTVLLLWASLCLIGYTYLGYPVLIAMQARRRPQPVSRASWTPSVDVIMAVYNGQDDLPRKLDNLLALDWPADRLRVRVASDGSTDQTVRLLSERAGDRVAPQIFAARRGKSACLADLIAQSDAEVLLFTDLRQRIEPEALRALCENLADAEVGAVSGELMFEDQQGYALGVDAYWRYEKFIRRQESLSGSVVGVSGALYAAKRSCMPTLQPGLILDDLWVPMQLAFAGKRVLFEPGARAWDRASGKVGLEAARKRRTLAGNYQLMALWPALLDPRRNPLWWRFVSHKLLRLAVPLFLLIALAANWRLAHWYRGYAWMFDAQLLAYAVAIAGLLIPVLKRWLPVRLASTFLEMNVYAVLGLIEFLSNRQAHLWRGDKPREGTSS